MDDYIVEEIKRIMKIMEENYSNNGTPLSEEDKRFFLCGCEIGIMVVGKSILDKSPSLSKIIFPDSPQ